MVSVSDGAAEVQGAAVLVLLDVVLFLMDGSRVGFLGGGTLTMVKDTYVFVGLRVAKAVIGQGW